MWLKPTYRVGNKLPAPPAQTSCQRAPKLLSYPRRQGNLVQFLELVNLEQVRISRKEAAYMAAIWVPTFKKALKWLWKNRDKLTILVKPIRKVLRDLGPKVREWWNGKKLAVIGPKAVGKNCLYCRLTDQPIPEEHHQTKNPEKIQTFTYDCVLPNKKQFKIKFKHSTNVGGEKEQRERYWFDACKNADVIFYMMDMRRLQEGLFGPRTRVNMDLKWLASKMGQMKPNVVVHILVNKIDLHPSAKANSSSQNNLIKQLSKQVEHLEQTANDVFSNYANRLTGITPTSMKDDYYFNTTFPKALEQVYEAVHSDGK